MAQTSSIEQTKIAENPAIKKFIRDITSPIKQRLYLLWKLPSAFFMGVRIRSVTPEAVTVTLPYGWRSQNPFRSTYFAAQAAAAEMSTGVLGMMAKEGQGKVSMLVLDIKGDFVKKANKKTTFTCTQGKEIFETVQRAIETGEGQTITMKSVGTQPDENGNPVVVSRFEFTWTFKAKKSK